VAADSGLPLLRPNQFILVARRDRCQVATLKADLGALALVLGWAHHYGVDLDELIESGRGLDQHAVVSLVDALRVDYRNSRSHGNVSSLALALVIADTWANRIAIARDFLAWNLADVLSKCEPGTLRYQHIRERRDGFIRAMNARIPRSHPSSHRKGLSAELKSRLALVVTPGSPENPFQLALQERNALIIDVLQTLGVRRAELCKLRTSDFRPGPKPTLSVVRLPDDPDDPRLHQPQVKTLSRMLPLDARLAGRLQRYIVKDRRELPNANRTPFLFLARTGKPIALSTVNNIFKQISLWHREFAGLLSPHVLRHTANDDLSETLNAVECGPELAKEIRNFLNGWDPDSSQGIKYNRRYLETKAAEVSLAHQRRLFDRDVLQ
jgi:integrase